MSLHETAYGLPTALRENVCIHFVQKYWCVLFLVLGQTSPGVIISVCYVLCISSLWSEKLAIQEQ